MEISKNLAMNIVVEMKKIIGKNINFIKTDGKIIASTDENRIDTYHEGATIVVKSKEKLIIENNDEYIGSKEGINMPIVFQNEIIGIIGISGKKKEIQKYGQIIKKMTEILIKEEYLKKIEDNEIENERFMLESLLINKNLLSENNIIYKNFDKILLKKDGNVICIKILDSYDVNINKNIFKFIKEMLKSYDSYIMIRENVIVFLVFKVKKEILEDFLDKIIVKINKIYKIKIKIGIGSKKEFIKDLNFSYKEAISALSWCLETNKNKIFYDDMNLEIILNNIDSEISKNYLEKIFFNLNLNEIEEYNNIFSLYGKYNGSIEKISREIFIHKNTLQYKLNKFKEKTNLDMRKYEDYVILKIAFMLLVHKTKNNKK